MPTIETAQSCPLGVVKNPHRDIDFEVQFPQNTAESGLQSQGSIVLKARLVGPKDAPVILAMGGISANRHVCDLTQPDQSKIPGWWRELAGADRPLDTRKFQILSFDFFPNDAVAKAQALTVSPASQARLVHLLCDYLGIDTLHAWVGASYGGMVGLNFAQLFPERLNKLVVACASHRPHPLGAAWRSIQRKIVRLGLSANQPEVALSLARELGMTTYRTAEEFGQRFATGEEANGYLESRGQAFLGRMSPERYLCLSESIDLHRVEPATIQVPVSLIAFRQDQLVPIDEVRALRDQLPQLASYHEFDSIYGHDAFLKEVSLMAQCFKPALC